jgi:hypothetical protein
MPIHFTCPYCGKQTDVDEQYAGSSGPCAGCGKTVTVPGGKEFPLSGPKPGGAQFAPPMPQRSGMPVVAIVLIVCGVMFFLLIGMAALLLPAIHAAREAANRATCKNNLRKISLAILNYHDQIGELPPRYVPDAGGRPMHSWRVLILPYLEDAEAAQLYTEYDFSEPWDGPNNRRLHDRMPRVFRCPSDAQDKSHTSYMVVAGENTALQPAVPRGRSGEPQPGENPVLRWRSPTTMASIVDGTPFTVCVVEVAGSQVNWLEPADLDYDDAIRGVNVSSAGDSISSPHPQLVQVGFLDARVEALREPVSSDLLERLLDRRDGRPVNFGELD